MTRIAIRAPDHLGDAVMALGAVQALAAIGEVTVYSRGRWRSELYAGIKVLQGDELPTEADVGVMLKPSWSAAWRWRHLPTVGVGPQGRYGVTLAECDEHRRDRYARIARAGGALHVGEPTYRPRGIAPELPSSFVAINPWNPSHAVRWSGFPALAQALGNLPVVAFCGPGEATQVRALLGSTVHVVCGLSLPDFAAALSRCVAFVSNDSGAAHFAAACGVPVVMVHGSTSPEQTGVGTPVERASRLWCQPCYRKICLWGTPCLTVEVEAVRVRVLELIRKVDSFT